MYNELKTGGLVAFMLLTACMPEIREMDYFLCQPVTINEGSVLIRASVLEEEKTIRPDNSKTYYWFRSGHIRTTQGGIGGKVLNGSYTAFYKDKNIKEKGEFSMGLKDGEWKSWYPDGTLQTVYNWKDGLLSGRFVEYNESGGIRKSGKYKRGKLRGKVEVHHADGKKEVIKYRNGEKKIRKKPEKKPPKEKVTKSPPEAKKKEKKKRRWLPSLKKKKAGDE